MSVNDFQPGGMISVGSSTYNRVIDFLYTEARLLDEVRLREWAALLTQDLVYTAPLRETRSMAQMSASVVQTTKHFEDDWRSIMGRVMRLTETKSAWAEDPPSRTRRMVTNVMVEQGDKPGELRVRSYLLVTRSRFNADEFDIISAERRDVLRDVDGHLRLARREILLDQAVLGTPNLAIFL
ncbi:aromatic-ring-hydroxylating dioxygenase subunit beta [Caldimonas thermodepolymerans]|jgi:3-phenylpropionate/cinnamic acid dioxygenase small subunit|uniref:aromatic-ring-hydroxylating dioxygenase subunit beta n=1 Tax=Caldimonas thermodepolymerans TaxID=215580 RepID=UPI00223636BF|nr:3-phenylpropionate/cinnamic acid dioxygenase subunit beta [Caldimonas thermodepolymerans]UZG46053.1 3-phenylpropionate/cinnamic acid dioxygenase subunit beta [Caldimonas thermodepolymerans]